MASVAPMPHIMAASPDEPEPYYVHPIPQRLKSTINYMDYRRLRRQYHGVRQRAQNKRTFIVVVFCLILTGFIHLGYFDAPPEKSFPDSGEKQDGKIWAGVYIRIGQTPREIIRDVVLLLFVIKLLLMFARIQTSLSLRWSMWFSYAWIILCVGVYLLWNPEEDPTTEEPKPGWSEREGLYLFIVYLMAQLVIIVLTQLIIRYAPRIASQGFWCPCGESLWLIRRRQNYFAYDRASDCWCGNNPCCFITWCLRSIYRCSADPGVRRSHQPFSHQLRYKGGLDDEGRPDGYGEWLEDTETGERLQGYWCHGFPIGPFVSQEVGTGSIFVTCRIAYASCRNPKKPNMVEWGVASVECSVSGSFFQDFPLVRYFDPTVDMRQPLRAPRPYRPAVEAVLHKTPKRSQAGTLRWCLRMLKESVDVPAGVEDVVPSKSIIIAVDRKTSELRVTTQPEGRLGVRPSISLPIGGGGTSPAGVRKSILTGIPPTIGEEDQSNAGLSDVFSIRVRPDGRLEVNEGPVAPRYKTPSSHPSSSPESFVRHPPEHARTSVSTAAHRAPAHDMSPRSKQRARTFAAGMTDEAGMLPPLSSDMLVPAHPKLEEQQRAEAERERERETRVEIERSPRVHEELMQHADGEESVSVLDDHSDLFEGEPPFGQIELLREDIDMPGAEGGGGGGRGVGDSHRSVDQSQRTLGSLPRSLFGGDSKEVVIFIHGFNTQHAQGLGQMAQLVAFAKLPSRLRPFVFTWPGDISGPFSPLMYPLARNQAHSRDIREAFTRCIKAFKSEGVRRVHIMSHSAGARTFFNGMRGCYEENLFLPSERPRRRRPRGERMGLHGMAMTSSSPNRSHRSTPDHSNACPSPARMNGVNNGEGIPEESDTEDNDDDEGEGEGENEDKGGLQVATVLLLNPDYPLDVFLQEEYEDLRDVCSHITLYGDTKDQALGFSEVFNRQRSLGKRIFDLRRPLGSYQVPPTPSPRRLRISQTLATAIENPGRLLRGDDLPLGFASSIPPPLSPHIDRDGDTPPEKTMTQKERDRSRRPPATASEDPSTPVGVRQVVAQIQSDDVTSGAIQSPLLAHTLTAPAASGPLRDKERDREREGVGNRQSEADTVKPSTTSGSRTPMDATGGTSPPPDSRAALLHAVDSYASGTAESFHVRPKGLVAEGRTVRAAGDTAEGAVAAAAAVVTSTDETTIVIEGVDEGDDATTEERGERPPTEERQVRVIESRRGQQGSRDSRVSSVDSAEAVGRESVNVWLDIDVVDTTFVDHNSDVLRHCFYNINREFVDDIREILVTGRRARDRVTRLDRRRGNVFCFRVAPSFIHSLWG